MNSGIGLVQKKSSFLDTRAVVSQTKIEFEGKGWVRV